MPSTLWGSSTPAGISGSSAHRPVGFLTARADPRRTRPKSVAKITPKRGSGVGLGGGRVVGERRLVDRLLGFTEIDAHGAGRTGQTVDGGARDQIAVERNGTARVVVTPEPGR